MRTIVLPGRLSRWKGQEVLLDAMARLARPDVCCVLVGADQGRRRYTAELVRLAERLGVADRLRFAGECDDMPAAMMLADVVVHASTAPEPFGRVVIEAQAMARPVIASDLGGPVETVEHGRHRLARPAGRRRTRWRRRSTTRWPCRTRRAALGGSGRGRPCERGYTTEAMQEATLAVYRELLG